jgi:hypothetical protein
MKYTKERLAPIVAQNISVAGVLRDLGLKITGGSHSYLVSLMTKFELDTSHFKGQASNAGAQHQGGADRKPWQKVLLHNPDQERRTPAFLLRRSLIEMGRPYHCEGCSQEPLWNGRELRLQVEHSSGDWRDNRPENLMFLCPNCHSQTTSHSGSLGLTTVTSRAAQSRRRREKKQDPVVEG